MNDKTKAAVIYCIVCTVLFIILFTVLSYSIRMPGIMSAFIAAAVYCVVVIGGIFLILYIFKGFGVSSEPPGKGLKPLLGLLTSMGTPVIVTNGDGKITWSNLAFQNVLPVPFKKDQTISQFCNLSVRSLLKEENADGVICELNGNYYRVYGCQSTNGQITSVWIDISGEKQLVERLENERIIIASVIVDMADNFLSGLHDNYAQASAAVSRLLYDWAADNRGFINEYETGKYVMIINAEHLESLRRSSFAILDEVKKITFGEDAIPMTISVGIADSNKDLSAKYGLAKEAMQFALQRGGDQVVIKNDVGKAEFFGGTSKHDPQLTSLNARRLITQALPLLKKAGSVLIMGHKNADFDCLAACIGIAKICLLYGKKPVIVVKRNKNIEKPYDMLKESPDYKDLFYDFDRDSFDMIESDSLLFIVDVNNPFIFEYPKLTEQVSKIIIIDHHRRASSDMPFDPEITYIEPSASSASEIVSQMIEQIAPAGIITPDEANLLLAGMQLDTNNFTRDCGAGTYAAAQYLRREGADSSVSTEYFNLDRDDFMTELKIESTMRQVKEGFYICTGSDQVPITEPATAARVAETIMRIKGVHASFAVCRLKTPNGPDPLYTVSARSDGTVNVQVILERLGGGGHHSNAGAQLSNGKTVPLLDKPTEDLNMRTVVLLLEAAINGGKITLE